MGGVTRRSLLASLMALSLLCGGWGAASASLEVVDQSGTAGTVTIYTKDEVDKALEAKGAATDVASNTANIAANKDNINKLDTKKLDKDLANSTFATKDALNDLEDAVNNKVDESVVETALDGKADKADTLAGYGIKDAYTKGDVDNKLNEKADAANVFTKDQTYTRDQVNTKLADYAKTTDVNTALAGKANVGDSYTKAEADGQITTAKNELGDKITANTTKIDANKTAIDDLKTKAATTENTLTNLSGRMAAAESDIDGLQADMATAKSDIGTLKADVSTAKSDINSLKMKDTELTGKIEAEIANRITSDTALDNKINAEIANRITSDTALDNKIDTEIQDRKDAIKATNDRTGGIARNTEGTQTTIEGIVKVDNQGNVKDVKGLSAETITTTGDAAIGGTLGVTGATTLDGALTANGEATFKDKVSVEKDLTVNGKLNVGEISMKNVELDAATGNKHDSATSITADGISNIASIENGGTTTKSQFSHNEKGTFNSASKGDSTDWKEATFNVTADGVENIAKDSKGNNNTFTQTSTDTKNTLTDKEGNTSTTRQDSKGIYGYAKDKDGNKSYTKQEGNRIAESVIGQDGKQTKSEMTSTDITNTAKDGTITSDAKDIVNKATGNISNSSATMDTTVTGKATESYGELETEVKGNEKHTVKGDQTNEVDGKQINTIKNGQENIISGGQTNTITGGQTNNITGDQTTTITGNKKETVTENVTEDYKKDLTTTVGGNEIHEVKGTKTETVEGKLTENFKGGQETNVTGDQTTNVSGTQTINATDINRNASSGMIDTVDNAYGTNKETKVAGSTTTEVSIKGTGESGTYIRGATEARDYIIKGTLSNSETKTAEATSTKITDGNGKTSSTIQDKTQISGSVTNGTSSAVSNVKADSIDTAVIEGTNTSLISQKKDSITSAVGNGTTSTVIQQGDKDITIASNGGTVGIVGKDIINNATDEITNTAGTKITDKVGNNTRVINQTSITDTVGTASRKIEDGKITDTAGDSTVTTENGKGTTFAKAGSTAYSTKAGAPTDTNIAGNHITTGRVDANELGVSDKDGDNTADFSVKAGKGVKASAGNGNTTGSLDVKADGIYGSATDKDGNKTSTKVTATENSFQVQDKDGNIKNHQVNTKDKSENTITNGDKTNTVTSTADGTTFNNSKANTAFEGGTYTDTTIKGNTITTGKVTMDYAEVMRDLGVNGNANITGKTTTGSLEVKGESKLTGNVTMENNATVGNDLTVKGITNTKTLNVTEDAKVGRNLAVDGNATIAGDVTARSYKVDGKTYIDANGIHANNQKITNVADGSISEGSKDAVNGGQLYGVKNDLEGKVNKVGANAAAMANLHPMEFDPDSKWNIAAAIGNYGSETAAALGAFYRPNDDVMVNLSTAFGTGENMVGGGVSVRLGKGGNKLSREESNALKDQVNDLTARMDALLSVLNPNMSKDFPDVPENHWAYEAVSRLAGNDIVQGYPDGEFHGERTMTRYEMAEIIYNALSRGAEAEKELVEEFKPELQAMAASEKATAERAEG